MKNVPIIMPQMGQSVAEGTIVKWRKQVGEAIEADEIIVEIESDKISFEVESPATGRLASCLKTEGQTAGVGEVIGQIEAMDEAPPAQELAKETRAHMPHAGAGADEVLVSTGPDINRFDFTSLPEITRDWFSPYVLRMAVMNNISIQELQSIRGTGRQGRVSKHDLLRYLARRTGSAPTAERTPKSEPMPDNVADLGQVVPMTSIRKTIADHMVQSIRTSAHVTMVHAVDMTHIVELRERIKNDFQRKYGVKMTYTAVMIYVTARVLRQFPSINSSVYGTNIVLKKDIHIGCAVALQDESLVVPVVRNPDKKSFPQVAQELEKLIQLARQKALTRADVEGGTFTISNFGAFGSIIGTPIINQPQVAILGMGAVFKAPVVCDGQIRIRDQVYLSFTFDHRVIDGAMGGRFLNAIQRMTESLTEESLDVAAL